MEVQGGGIMSNDRKPDSNKSSADRSQESADIKERKAIGRFATYTSPALLALLVSERALAQVSTG